MFKTPTGVAVLVVAGLACLACSSTDAAAPDAAGVASPDGSADSLGGDSCVTPTEGAACSADATVCPPNSCCDGNPIYWVCTNGRWDYGIPCHCVL